jgi:hypothetical protein
MYVPLRFSQIRRFKGLQRGQVAELGIPRLKPTRWGCAARTHAGARARSTSGEPTRRVEPQRGPSPSARYVRHHAAHGGVTLSRCYSMAVGCAFRNAASFGMLRLTRQGHRLDRKQVCVRRRKGRKDRMTLLPANLVKPLQQHLGSVERQHHADLDAGAGHVELPEALAREFPTTSRSWSWQWVFPARRKSLHVETAQRRRHHLHETVLQRAVQAATLEAGVNKRQLPHVSPLVRGLSYSAAARHSGETWTAGSEPRQARW